MNEFTTEDYKKFKQEKNLKVHGWFMFGKPALSINDVDIIKQVQVLFRTCDSLKSILARSKISTILWTETRQTSGRVSTREQSWIRYSA